MTQDGLPKEAAAGDRLGLLVGMAVVGYAATFAAAFLLLAEIVDSLFGDFNLNGVFGWTTVGLFIVIAVRAGTPLVEAAASLRERASA